ncbi:site-specific integrase [Frigoribacterium sp. UYMn621]|uniref:tyrosine-type recombinase/integrase n=1 Tax=Frigoribacterium sp. UYMn621 TaxID=3156343 RepID=UPI003393BAA2
MPNLEFAPSDEYGRKLREELPPHFLLDPISPDTKGRYSRKECIAVGCVRISTKTDLDFCKPHGNRFTASAEKDPVAWAQSTTAGRKRIAPENLFNVAHAGSTLVRDELAFGLMKRGERNRPVRPLAVNAVARGLARLGVGSILELRYDASAIDEIVNGSGGAQAIARSALLDTLDELCIRVGIEPTRRYLGLGSAGRGAFANLNNIANPEFRKTAQRWVDYRTSSEQGAPSYIQSTVLHLTVFCAWLEGQNVTKWSQLTREHMVRFLDFTRKRRQANGEPYTAKYRSLVISSLTVFVDEVRLNDWADIPLAARWLRSERPRVPRSNPRLIGKSATARLRTPGNLQLIEDLDCRLIIRIIAETGLRRKDVCNGIAMDALSEVDEGKWSLRYLNSKSNEYCWAPVEPALAEAIKGHIRFKRAKYPTAKMLFAVDEHDRIITLTLVNSALTSYAKELDLRDSSGKYLRVTPHMFRHQNATDWLEAGVTIPVIQKLLGQKSMQTTEIYARMSEEAAREQWEGTIAVNSDGEIVQSKSGDVADAAWVHAFMGGATQALPNGRCGLHCSESCEHANACLYCPLFLTTPEYLPVLREQRAEHLIMIELAEKEGHQRIVEKNQKPFFALTKLIQKLERIDERDKANANV